MFYFYLFENKLYAAAKKLQIIEINYVASHNELKYALINKLFIVYFMSYSFGYFTKVLVNKVKHFSINFSLFDCKFALLKSFNLIAFFFIV